MSDKTAVFIDGGYLSKVAQSVHLGKTDFGTFPQSIAKGHDLLRTYYYDCPPYQSTTPTAEERDRFGKKQRFFDSLRKKDKFEVRLGYLRQDWIDRSAGKVRFIQKGADIWLAVDLLRLSFQKTIQRALLVAGDGDFVPVVHAAKDFGVTVHLFHGPNSDQYSDQLWAECDERTPMDRAFFLAMGNQPIPPHP
jgi:uncharacterized LabA/DUF88 family protein